MWHATYHRKQHNVYYPFMGLYMHVHCPSCRNTFINLAVQNPWLGLTSMTTTNLPTDISLMLPLWPSLPWNHSSMLFLQVKGSFSKYLSLHLINISFWNHVKKNTPIMGMSPPIFSAIWTICYHCNMLLLQMLLLNQNIDQSLFLWWSLDLSMHQNSCHTIHREEKYMSTMK